MRLNIRRLMMTKQDIPLYIKQCEYIENPNLGYIDTGIDVKYESNIKQVMVCNFYNSDGWVGVNAYLQQFFTKHTVRINDKNVFSLSDEKTTIICTWKNHVESLEVGSNKHEWAWEDMGYATNHYQIYKLSNFLNGRPINGRMYSLKLYESDELVRDYISAYNTQTSEYGMWDKVNREFYGSANGGKFTGVLLGGGKKLINSTSCSLFDTERRAA